MERGVVLDPILSEPSHLIETLHWSLVIARIIAHDRRLHYELLEGASVPARDVRRDPQYPLRRVLLLSQLRLFIFLSKFHEDEWIRLAVSQLEFPDQLLIEEPLYAIRRIVITHADELYLIENATAERLKERRPWQVRTDTVGQRLACALFRQRKDPALPDRVLGVLALMKLCESM